MSKRETYRGGVCDYTKATTCKKEHCSYLGRGDCRNTTNPKWMKIENGGLKNGSKK